MTFEYAQLGLADILNQRRLVVPRNQRDYAWTAKEVKTLLKDFARSINEGDADYFVGTIVTILRGDDTLEVVDGQQRLATTAIVLAEMRNYLQSRAEVRAEFIETEFLTAVDWDAEERTPRLRLNVDDNDYFWARVLGEEAAPEATKKSHKRLEAAFDVAQHHVLDIVAPHAEEDHGDVLNRWLRFIQKRATAVLLCVPTDADAYRMFETLNDRGLRASQADLVKNYLFGRSGERINEAQQRWSQMRGALEAIGDADDVTVRFLRHALTLVRGFVRRNDVYSAVQKLAKAPRSTITFAGQLETLAGVYASTYNTGHEHWNRLSAAKENLEVLNIFDIKPLRPVILAIAARFKERETAGALEFCVALAVRLMITGSTRTGSVEEGLADAAHKVYESKVAGTQALMKALRSITPSDASFVAAFRTASVSNAKLARYYLRCMERYVQDEKQPWLIPNDEPSEINLEHVLPVKPEENWPEFGADEVKLYGKRIGNLCLLTARENSVVKSASFKVKRPFYEDSPYKLTSEIADEEEWTAEKIAARQEALSGIAKKTWLI